MRELTKSQRIEVESRLRELIQEIARLDPELISDYLLTQDPAKLGDFVLEQLQGKRAVNDVKKDVTLSKDFNKRKSLLLELEYLALRLNKHSTIYGME